MEYLRKIYNEVCLPAQFAYIDRPVLNALPLPRRLQRAVGSFWSAADVVRMSGDRPVVHVNASLYPSTVLRDAPVVAAAVFCGFPVFLQVHGGRLSNLTRGTLPGRVWHWMCARAVGIGVYPGSQWKEFERAGFEHKMHRMHNLVPSTDHTAPLEDPPHFLFLGRVVEEKGAADALDAFLRLREEGHDDIQMTIAGDGTLVGALRERVRASAHADAVSIPGFVRDESLNQVRRRANVFVLPSRHQEGFPLSFLECAERGMACIVTTNSAIPDVFESGKEFQPVDLEEPEGLYRQMKRMVTDPDHRERIGRAGQAAVRTCCTIEAAADRFEILYCELSK